MARGNISKTFERFSMDGYFYHYFDKVHNHFQFRWFIKHSQQWFIKLLLSAHSILIHSLNLSKWSKISPEMIPWPIIFVMVKRIDRWYILLTVWWIYIVIFDGIFPFFNFFFADSPLFAFYGFQKSAQLLCAKSSLQYESTWIMKTINLGGYLSNLKWGWGGVKYFSFSGTGCILQKGCRSLTSGPFTNRL